MTEREDFILVKSGNEAEFVRQVNEKISEGYVPLWGQIMVTQFSAVMSAQNASSATFVQAMVLRGVMHGELVPLEEEKDAADGD